MVTWRPLTPGEDPVLGEAGAIRTAWAPVGHSALIPPGGTEGQVLVKSSATNYDVVWSEAITVYEQTDEPTEAVVGSIWVVP
jgi:hypothetical protein